MTTQHEAAEELPLPIGGTGSLETRWSRSLYDIAGDFRLIEEALPEASDDEAVDLLQEFFNRISDEAEDKLDDYCELIQEFLARAEVRIKEANRLSQLGNSDKRQAERMKATLLWFLQTRGLRKKETVHFKISRQLNGGILPLELLVEPERLPDDLRFVTYQAHTDAIREQLASAAQELEELDTTRKMLHSLSGLGPEDLELLTGLLRQAATIEAQLGEMDAGPNAETERRERLGVALADTMVQIDAVCTFSKWSTDHRQQIAVVEARLAGPPWCWATFRARGEHLRIR